MEGFLRCRGNLSANSISPEFLNFHFLCNAKQPLDEVKQMGMAKEEAITEDMAAMI